MDSAGRNIFLYFAYFAIFASASQFGMSFLSHERAPSPALARRGMRTTSFFSLLLGIPVGVLGLSERFAWFADDPSKKLLLMGGVTVAEAVVIWFYVRALRPIADELKRIKEQGTAVPSKEV